MTSLLFALALCLELLVPGSCAIAAEAPSALVSGATTTSALPADQTDVFLSGWVVTGEGERVYYSPVTHRPYTGWLVQGPARYYIDADTHQAHVGWLDVGGRRYWMSDGSTAPAGVMLADRWIEVDGNRYHLSTTGAVDVGRVMVDGVLRYFGADGRQLTGWVTGEDGGRRWIKEDGQEAAGEWVEVDGVFQAFDADGTWVTIEGLLPPYDAANVASMTARQRAVVEACEVVDWPGPNLCAAWVSAVLDRAVGVGVGGNACDMARAWCTSGDLADLKPGMIIAVPTHSRTEAGSIYGHVGIYVGGGMIVDSARDTKRHVALGTWLAWYGVTEPPRWGWAGGVDLSA